MEHRYVWVCPLEGDSRTPKSVIRSNSVPQQQSPTMRSRIIARCLMALAMASRVLAQSAADMIALTPTCALPCVTEGVLDASCPLTSLTGLSDCLCTNITTQASMSECVQTSCSFKDQVDSGNLLMGLCAAYPKQSRTTEVKIVAIMAVAATLVVVIPRCVARIHLTGRLWSDDYLAITSALLLVGGGGLELASAELGFGRHFWDVYVTNASRLLQIFYAVEIIYTWVKLIAKASIIAMYLRVFTGRGFRWACFACLGYCGISLTIFTFVIAFQCRPVEAIWNRFIAGQCLDVNAIGYAGAIMSVVEDLVLMVLPIPELRKLQVSSAKRVGVALMFVLASFATVTSMIRLKFLVQFSATFDSTYDNVDAIVWSMIELTCVIVCGSLPPLRPYLGKMFPSLETIAKSFQSRSKSFKGQSTVSTDPKGTELSNMSRSRADTTKEDKNMIRYPIHRPAQDPMGDEFPLRPMESEQDWKD
ncbi:integral membrane protein [Xylariaceae sp. FL0016]|nr:integral membrane protein [Xylariaceae sp. FL0016]